MLLAMQYRSDFVVDGVIEAFWVATALIALFAVFKLTHSLAGWSFGEALMVVGWFTLLQAILEGAINPSLTAVVDHIRKGTLDFVLLKPADAQFLVSTAKFQPWRSLNLLTGLAVFAYAFHLLGPPPTVAGLLASLVLLMTSTPLLYSLWVP